MMMALDKIRLAVQIADKAGTRVELKPSEVMMLFDRIAELERVLRMVEWVGDTCHWCPWCDQDIAQGHSSDCPRQKVLGKDK